MNRNVKDLIGFNLKETDGEIGSVEDLYFDDLSWKVRYLVVKTGNWFTGRKVLISPKSLKKTDWESKEFLVNLTKEQIRNSPDIDTEKPVSRQQEEQLYAYYPWGTYWGADPEEHGGGIFGAMPSDLYNSELETAKVQNNANAGDDDHHLRSTNNVTGYKIHETDGEVGKVVDYLIDDHDWKINNLVVETGTWLDSKKVLLSIKQIKEVNWENSVVIVDLTSDEVENGGKYNVTTA